MGINQRVAAKVVSFKGQKSGVSLESTNIEDSSSTVNMVLKEGQMEKINGGTIYAEILGSESGGITSLSRFKNLTIAQRGFSIAAEDSEGAATFTTLTSSLESNNPMRYDSWRDRQFMVNGVDAKFLLNRGNGSLSSSRVFGDFGLDPPNFPDSTVDGIPLNTSYDSYSGLPTLVITTVASGGAVAVGTYYYIMTFFDAETNSESAGWGSIVNENGFNEISTSTNFDFGPKKATVVVSSAAKNVVFDKTTLIQYLQSQQARYPRITHFALYRGASSTGSFFQVPLIDTGSSQHNFQIINIEAFIADNRDFIDNTVTASLPVTSLPENNFYAPSVPRFERTWQYFTNLGSVNSSFDSSSYSGFRHIKFFRDQLFGVGAKSPGIDFRTDIDYILPFILPGLNNFSDILHGSEVYQPDYFPYIWEVGRGDGQTTVGLGVLGDTALLVFKNKSTYYLSGSSPDNFTLRIMDTKKGCINEGTIQETPNGVICLDRAGFVLFNKIGQGEKISKDIQDIIDDIQTQYADTFYSWYDPEQMRYYCALVVGSGATTPNTTVCLDLDSQGWTTIKGTEGLSRVMDTDSNGVSVDIMGSKTNGRLTDFSDPTQVLFNGEMIESSWTSGVVNFGDDQHKKKVDWLYVRALSKETWTADIEIIPDFDESRKYVYEDWNVLASQSEWYSSDVATDGTLLWDEGNWASEGLVRTISKIPIKSLGTSFQIRIINKETNPERYGFILQSVSIEGTVMGR